MLRGSRFRAEPTSRCKKTPEEFTEPLRNGRVATWQADGIEVMQQTLIPKELSGLEAAAWASQEIILRRKLKTIGVVRLACSRKL